MAVDRGGGVGEVDVTGGADGDREATCLAGADETLADGWSADHGALQGGVPGWPPCQPRSRMSWRGLSLSADDRKSPPVGMKES